MIQLEVTGRFSPEFLERVRSWADADPIRLARRVERIVAEGNRKGLYAQRDALGGRMEDVKDSTIRRGRGGFGPPTIPRFSGSRFIDRFEAKASALGVRGYRVRVGWKDAETARIAGILSKGHAPHNLPPRPLNGIRPETQEELRAAAREYAEDLLRGNP